MRVSVSESWADAVESVPRITDSSEMVVLTGSLYLVSDFYRTVAAQL